MVQHHLCHTSCRSHHLLRPQRYPVSPLFHLGKSHHLLHFALGLFHLEQDKGEWGDTPKAWKSQRVRGRD